MAVINKVEKTDYNAIKIAYTDKDYTNILEDLINSIPGISEKWDTTDENDIGIILVKLMSILGDMLFYNLDVQSLEVYPNTVTQRKNASVIYKLIGYKMRWYKSAIVEAFVVNTYTQGATLPRFCTFTTSDESITYTTFEQDYEIPSNYYNNGIEVPVLLIEGVPVTPIRKSNSPYPAVGEAWHTIYDYNFTSDDVINNRIYLKSSTVDQDHIIVVDNTGAEWELKENIYLTNDVGKFFEFGVDVNDQPYIELVDYWGNFNVNKFKVFYIRSSGENGVIQANQLTRITGSAWSRTGTTPDAPVFNVSSFIKYTHYASSNGYDPETPSEARKNSVAFQNTIDTIITLADFERATLREVGVANVRATDLTNDPGMTITKYVGDINQDGTIDDLDVNMLNDYLADPATHPLTSFQKKLADTLQIGETGPTNDDLQRLIEYVHPTMWYLGDIDQSGVVDTADLQLLDDYLADPSASTLTNFQLRLADVNQDGVIDSRDRDLLHEYVTHAGIEPFGQISDEDLTGHIGKTTLSTVELLDGFVVKLYVVPTESYEDYPEEDFGNMIKEGLADYKILPLTIEVDTHSINKYYWSVRGKFYTRKPMSQDELQTIIVDINRNLKHAYSVDKMNFNTVINYKDVIENILAVNPNILMVDLEPIEYRDTENNLVDKNAVTGEYTQVIDLSGMTSTHITITLDNPTILPGSLMIKVNDGQSVLRDNNNKEIYNTGNILRHKGSIDYVTGEIDLDFNSMPYALTIDYVQNKTNIAVYRNLSTQEFFYDASSLEKGALDDLI